MEHSNNHLDNKMSNHTPFDSKLIMVNVYNSIKQHLEPFIEEININRSNSKIINDILKQMPEFQALQKENEELKKQLNSKNTTQLQNSNFRTNDKIILEIFE